MTDIIKKNVKFSNVANALHAKNALHIVAEAFDVYDFDFEWTDEAGVEHVGAYQSEINKMRSGGGGSNYSAGRGITFTPTIEGGKQINVAVDGTTISFAPDGSLCASLPLRTDSPLRLTPNPDGTSTLDLITDAMSGLLIESTGLMVNVDDETIKIDPAGRLKAVVNPEAIAPLKLAPDGKIYLDFKGALVTDVADGKLMLKLGDAFIQSPSSGLTLNIPEAGGLAQDATGIHVKAGEGIRITNNGVNVALKAQSGLALNADGLSVNPSASVGINDSNQIYVKVKETAGLSIEGGVGVKVDGQTIKINADGELIGASSVGAGKGTEIDADQKLNVLVDGNTIKIGSDNKLQAVASAPAIDAEEGIKMEGAGTTEDPYILKLNKEDESGLEINADKVKVNTDEYYGTGIFKNKVINKGVIQFGGSNSVPPVTRPSSAHYVFCRQYDTTRQDYREDFLDITSHGIYHNTEGTTIGVPTSENVMNTLIFETANPTMNFTLSETLIPAGQPTDIKIAHSISAKYGLDTTATYSGDEGVALVTLHNNESKTFRGEYTLHLGSQTKTIDKSASVRALYPVQYGFSAVTPTSLAGFHDMLTATGVGKVFNDRCENDGCKFYILYAEGVQRPNRYSMGGAPAHLEIDTVTIDGVTYTAHIVGGVYSASASVNFEGQL